MLPDASFDVVDEPSTFTDQWYALLPAFMRHLDAGQSLHLFRFMRLLGDQGQEVAELADAAESGRLTDPMLTPSSMVAWLAQMVGLSTVEPVPEETMRERIGDVGSVALPGSRTAIAATVRPLLTESRTVTVVPGFGGDPWAIGVVVRVSEAPEDLGEISAAIAASGVKPAGYSLTVAAASAPWSSWDALGATWGDGDTGGGYSWRDEDQATWTV